MMNGIDISHWQKGINLDKIQCDFVIAKATEGINFIDPCFHDFMRQAESLNKCMGFYHFARPENNSAKAEAKFFYNNAQKYFGKAIPVLDWESKGRDKVDWAKEWLYEIYQMTGIKPMIYMSESVANVYDWREVVDGNFGLWVAKYKDYGIDKNYDLSSAGDRPYIKHWSFYAMWQWTSVGRLDGFSGNLDFDVFYGDRFAWNKYAGAEESYIVQDGDSLTYIAKKLNVTVDALVEKNKLIKVGQRLII